MADDTVSETSYPCQLARREAVSQWLTSCAIGHINTEVQSADVKVGFHAVFCSADTTAVSYLHLGICEKLYVIGCACSLRGSFKKFIDLQMGFVNFVDIVSMVSTNSH